MTAATSIQPLAMTPMVRRLLRAVETKDAYTARHSRNVAAYARRIAAAMDCSPLQCELMHLAGHVHDVGKLGVDSETLRTPGRLNVAQWEEMRAHAQLSAVLLEDAVPDQILPWVAAHHERIDGKGYPKGLSGNDIPLGARILAVADSLDAMTTSRCYRSAMPFVDAMEELGRCSGAQFDPDVVAATTAAYDRGLLILSLYADRRPLLTSPRAPLGQAA